MAALLAWFVPLVTLLTAVSYLVSILRPKAKVPVVSLVARTTAAVGWMVFGSLVTSYYATTVWAWYVPASITAAGVLLLVARWDRLVDPRSSTVREWSGLVFAAVPTLAVVALRVL